MTESGRAVREMEEGIAMIRLKDEEEGGLMYDGTMEDTVSEIDIRWCLVGKFLTESSIDFQAMQDKMASLWRPGRGVYVKELETNRYIFQFYHEIDIRRVIEGSPWTFGRHQLVIERLKPGDDPRSIALNSLDLWVQLHGMNPGYMSQRVVQDVGNYIGSFVESDSNNFMNVWRDYLRVRVSVPLDRPLKRRMKLRKNEKEWCWVNFKYEGVPTFCFICGLMGHGEKFCEKLFEMPVENIEKPYGIWMRAEPKRKNHTIGAKWLRQGNNFPATNMTEGRERGSEKTVSGFGAGVKHNPMILGIRNDKEVAITGDDVNGKYGCSYDVVLHDTSNPVGQNSNFILEGQNNRQVNSDGLIVLDTKRRRVGGLDQNQNGPKEVKDSNDVVMHDPKEDNNQNQKNGLLAGTAVQARLEL